VLSWRDYKGQRLQIPWRELHREAPDFTSLLQDLYYNITETADVEIIRADDPRYLTVVPVRTRALIRTARSWDWDERGPTHVLAIRRAMRRGEAFPPAVIDSRIPPWLLDGRHRIIGAWSLGYDVVPVIDLKISLTELQP
jgi:hypothetical protein